MMLSTHHLSLKAQAHLLLDDITLTVNRHQTVGLLGPNGSGKSTLLRCLAGLTRPDSGGVTMEGVRLDTLGRRHIAQRLSLVEQHAVTDVDLTIKEVAALGRIPHRGAFSHWQQVDQQALECALQHTGLTALQHRRWHSLSGGERQRTQIARALAQKPDILLLDEPTNHLDIQHQLELLTLINTLPVTCIVSLHDLNLAAGYCDQLIVLDQGQLIAQGTPGEVLTPELIKHTYRVNARVATSPAHGGLLIDYLPPDPVIPA
ncbi:ABC transporter ATP-binding protein [Larsenimonas rhizosphaerae]|uniref:ABC transporter ATP-binding protein n=1 Tax=Larsenimonas rhizosphaerae TaxID=2944682 RepID=UPI00203422BA|nr:ABC transporter ATP-binding protein [Larsenimonas rhizosphaerae]MCM2130615.1 ABC transporter ATP-binding protein [Larsenimonas rhizosphaerae]